MPLKDTDVTIQNSRYMAPIRLQHLQRRFTKNQELLNDYKEFIEELYARKIMQGCQLKKLPLAVHGIFHVIPHNKSEEICAVFD